LTNKMLNVAPESTHAQTLWPSIKSGTIGIRYFL
jgi:hypothetical protein